MINQKAEIERGNWDWLLVFDACRYDVFKEVYEEFFEGNLKKARSKGSTTPEWAAKTFTKKFEDATYMSTNPFINGNKMNLKEFKSADAMHFDWRAVDHFKKVINLFELEWNDDIETVPPRKVNMSFFRIKPNKPTIIHYMQPYAPYITYKKKGKNQKNKDKESSKTNFTSLISSKLASKTNSRNINKLKGRLAPLLEKILGGTQNIFKIRDLLGLEPYGDLDEALLEGGPDFVKKLYRENLKYVSRVASNLVSELNGRIIITADHGESFGESKLWGHRIGYEEPALKNVPWLEIKNK